jgi:hypothetical protein
MVWESFGCGVHGARHASMCADTSEKATHDERDQAQLAEFRRTAKPCIKETAYSRITRQEKYECSDKKWSWALRVDNFAHQRAGHVHPD